MPNNEILLSIIIVAYNDAHFLQKCVSSIYEKFGARHDFEIIIVNNDKSQDILTLGLDFSKIRLIENSENVGFGRGNNCGAKESLGKYLFFLNSDTEILDFFPEKLLALFEKQKEIGIVGSGILTERGEAQEWCCGNAVTFSGILLNNLGIISSRKLWHAPKTQEVVWVSGTALFMPRELFLALGGFDENIFMYFEDVDLCERARQKGKKVLFFPEYRVLHKGGGAYSEENKREQKNNYYDSLVYYFKKHRPRAEFWAVKVLRRLFFA